MHMKFGAYVFIYGFCKRGLYDLGDTFRHRPTPGVSGHSEYPRMYRLCYQLMPDDKFAPKTVTRKDKSSILSHNGVDSLKDQTPLHLLVYIYFQSYQNNKCLSNILRIMISEISSSPVSSNISSVEPCTWPWPCRTRLSPRRTSSGTQPSDRRRLRPTWQQQQVCTLLNFFGGNVLLKFGPSEGHLQPRNKPTMFHQYERRLHMLTKFP